MGDSSRREQQQANLEEWLEGFGIERELIELTVRRVFGSWARKSEVDDDSSDETIRVLADSFLRPGDRSEDDGGWSKEHRGEIFTDGAAKRLYVADVQSASKYVDTEAKLKLIDEQEEQELISAEDAEEARDFAGAGVRTAEDIANMTNREKWGAASEDGDDNPLSTVSKGMGGGLSGMFRQVFGFDLDDGDIDNLLGVMFDSGEVGSSIDPDEMLDVLETQLVAYVSPTDGGANNLKPAMLEAFEKLANPNAYLKNDRLKIGSQWHDFDMDEQLVAFGGEKEDGKWGFMKGMSYATEIDGFAPMEWEVGGWFHDEQRRRDLPILKQLSMDAGVDTYLVAAILEQIDGWGAGYTEEEMAFMEQHPREFGLSGDGWLAQVKRSSSGKRSIKQGGTKLDIAKANYAAYNERVAAKRKKYKDGGKKRGGLMGSIAGEYKRGRVNPKQSRIAVDKAVNKALEKQRKVQAGIKDKRLNTTRLWKQVITRAKGYVDRFGSSNAALIAFQDEGMAGRVRDGTETGADMMEIDQIHARSRYSIELDMQRNKNLKQGRANYQKYLNAWSRYGEQMANAKRNGPGGGGAEIKAVAQLPSNEEVRQSVATLFTSWFQREATASEISTIKSRLDGAIIREANDRALAQANGGSYTTSDKEGLIMDTVKNLPEYARLFGNKQGSESEEQYANKFKQAATNMFGADLGADTGGLQAGMAEGTTATTLGYLSGKTDAADSSKYQETLANAAMIIARLT